MCKCENVQMLGECANVRMCKCLGNVQMLGECANVRMCKCLVNVRMCKCANVRM